MSLSLPIIRSVHDSKATLNEYVGGSIGCLLSLSTLLSTVFSISGENVDKNVHFNDHFVHARDSM